MSLGWSPPTSLSRARWHWQVKTRSCALVSSRTQPLLPEAFPGHPLCPMAHDVSFAGMPWEVALAPRVAFALKQYQEG